MKNENSFTKYIIRVIIDDNITPNLIDFISHVI